MGKSKKASINIIYLIGMALVAIGFLLPIFKFNFLGARTISGFDLVGDGNTAMKIYTLLIFIGGAAGIVFSLIKIPNASILKIVALIVSILGFVLVLVNMLNSDGASVIKGLGLGKNVGQQVFKSFYIGAYMIIVGWIVSIAGLVTNK